MKKIHTGVFSITLLLLLLLLPSSVSEQDDVILSLIAFLRKLSPENTTIDRSLGWRASSDPCTGGWRGVVCNNRTNSVQKINLDRLRLDGSVDAALLCSARLTNLSLRDNALRGGLSSEISNCSQLTHLLLSGNRLSGVLPPALARLKNLKRLDISRNNFSGELPPELAKISGIVTFLAQDNRLEGPIPPFDFANLQQFNVSVNRFSGPIPEGGNRFGAATYSANSGLCGTPLPFLCPPAPPPSREKSKRFSREKIGIFSGYIVLGAALLLFAAYKLIFKKKTDVKKKKAGGGVSCVKPVNDLSGASTPGETRSEFSMASSKESASAKSSLVVLNRTAMRKKTMGFEDLLRAPAELLGRGRYGSLYKVMFDDGAVLAVKRIKDWTLSEEEFRGRMAAMERARHRNVLPAVAYYTSMQEKLAVYEYQPNGSLFKLLHGSHNSGQPFDWSSRLSVAAGIAAGLAFMHQSLRDDGLAHGNLKSANVLMDANMDPRISEYGLVAIDAQTLQPSSKGTFAADVYAFGVILLELLTGKPVQSSGSELAHWVHSVVREEWTVEVFDKVLIADGASEESMVQLLQAALRCMNPSPEARPSMTQVSAMIGAVKEEEDTSSVLSEA